MSQQNKKNEPTSMRGRGKGLLNKADGTTVQTFAKFRTLGLGLLILFSAVATKVDKTVLGLATIIAEVGCVKDIYQDEKDSKLKWALFALLAIAVLMAILIAGGVIRTTPLLTRVPWSMVNRDSQWTALLSLLCIVVLYAAIRRASSRTTSFVTTAGRMILFCPSGGYPTTA
ncbi:MAG: hypothetical protein WB729_05685 [Candidatus Sulfotelmatobacter sp.]